jgi:diaminopimelate epimerase
MQTLHFTKMNGAGNDFVLLDNRAGQLRLQPELIARLCDRQRGVGADGVLLVEMPDPLPAAELRMRYFNSDGGEAEMCGNGARCFSRYAAHLLAGGNGGSREREQLSFQTLAGVIHARLDGQLVTLDLSEPGDGAVIGELDAGGTTLSEVFFLNTGVPHAVALVQDVETLDVHGLGRAIRHHARFAPRGTNANFIQTLGEREIRLRTYERGVEAETLACGTGATASALVHAERAGILGQASVAVRVQSGETLHIGFERTGPFAFRRVTLSGPADFVFEGKITI